jgi:hypothetical protein
VRQLYHAGARSASRRDHRAAAVAASLFAGASAILEATDIAEVAMKKKQIFLTGVAGAFAPQILRWYSQASVDLDNDPVQLAGRAFITVLFLGLAGYITVLWDVRNLKEAFFIGLGVPSIILSAGSDLGSLAKPAPAQAQVITENAYLVVSAKNDKGENIAPIRVTATDEQGKVIYLGRKGEALLPAGRYTIAVSASGYEVEINNISLAAKQTAKLEVTLKEKSLADRFIQGIQRPFEQRPPN